MSILRGTYSFAGRRNGSFSFDYLNDNTPNFLGVTGELGKKAEVIGLALGGSGGQVITIFSKDDSNIEARKSLLPVGLYQYAGPEFRPGSERTTVINGLSVSVPPRTGIVKAGACLGNLGT